nr:NDR1/HIN1-like protein 6 [Ipomoea batatas]
MPTYTVEGLDVQDFDVQDDFSLKTVFLVSVKAENPNAHLGFIYGKHSSVVVTYTDSVLSSGELPNFHQEPLNTTVMKIQMRGVKAPVNVVMGKVESREFIVYVNCSLVVDNLQPGKKVGIVKTGYSFDVQF